MLLCMTSNAGANESARTTDQGPFSPRHYSIRIPSAQEPPNEGTNQRYYVLLMMMLDVGRGLPSSKNMTVAASTMGTMMNSPKMNPHACSSIPCVHVERDSRIASLPTTFGNTSCRRFSKACEPPNLHAPLPNTPLTTLYTPTERRARRTNLCLEPWISFVMPKTSVAASPTLHPRPRHPRGRRPSIVPDWLLQSQRR